ncbi:hypothetical protein GQR58_026393 [Nymphon striatum]|nr:hypothetical protein GQR58_026393 [Nymphon striatum]
MDAEAAKAMSGIKDVVAIKSFKDDYEKGGFDVNAFPEIVAVVGNSTWEVLQAKKKLKVEWQPFDSYTETINGFRGTQTKNVPAGLESSTSHAAKMAELAAKPGKIVRTDVWAFLQKTIAMEMPRMGGGFGRKAYAALCG